MWEGCVALAGAPGQEPARADGSLLDASRARNGSGVSG